MADRRTGRTPALISFFIAALVAAVAAIGLTTKLLYSFSSVPNSVQGGALVVAGLLAIVFGFSALLRGFSVWILPAIIGLLVGLALVLFGVFLLTFQPLGGGCFDC